MAVTKISFPFLGADCSSRSFLSVIFALYFPYKSKSSSERPILFAISSMFVNFVF